MKKYLINVLNTIGLLTLLISVGISSLLAFDEGGDAEIIALILIIGGLIGFTGYILTFVHLGQK